MVTRVVAGRLSLRRQRAAAFGGGASFSHRRAPTPRRWRARPTGAHRRHVCRHRARLFPVAERRGAQPRL